MFRRHVADAVLLAACHGTLNSTQLLQLVNQLKQKSMEEGSGIIQSSVKQSIFIGEMDFTMQDATFMLSLIIGDGGGGEGNADGKVTHLVFTTFVLGIQSMLNTAAQHSAIEVYNKREKKLLTLVLGLFRESFEIDLCNGDIDEDRHKHDTKVVPVHSPSEKSPEPRSKKALATSTSNDTKVVPIHSPSEKSPEPQSKEALTTLTNNDTKVVPIHSPREKSLEPQSKEASATLTSNDTTPHPALYVDEDEDDDGGAKSLVRVMPVIKKKK